MSAKLNGCIKTLLMQSLSQFAKIYPLAFHLLVKKRAEAISHSPEFVLSEARSALSEAHLQEDKMRQEIALEKKLPFNSPEVTQVLMVAPAYIRLQSRKQGILSAISKSNIFLLGSPTAPQQEQARQEIERCISDLFLSPSPKALLYWNGRLSRAERAILGRFAGAGTLPSVLQEALSVWSYLDGRQYAVFCEPVIQTIVRQEKIAAWISLNSYGCEILNTQSILIADIDLPSDSHPACPQHSAKMPAFEEEIFERAQDIAKRGLGFRFYRTSAGYRAICISHTFDPCSAESREILVGLKSDPLYIALCRSQECFRARLTPKPWRAAGGGKYRVADYLRTVGRAKVAPEIETLVLLHDVRCGVGKKFKLA